MRRTRRNGALHPSLPSLPPDDPGVRRIGTKDPDEWTRPPRHSGRYTRSTQSPHRRSEEVRGLSVTIYTMHRIDAGASYRDGSRCQKRAPGAARRGGTGGTDPGSAGRRTSSHDHFLPDRTTPHRSGVGTRPTITAGGGPPVSRLTRLAAPDYAVPVTPHRTVPVTPGAGPGPTRRRRTRPELAQGSRPVASGTHRRPPWGRIRSQPPDRDRPPGP